MQSRGKRLWKSWLLLQMLSEISHTALEKRKKMTQGIPWQLCRPQEDLVKALLRLLAFNISIQAPYFSGISRRQTRVERRTRPGVWERQMRWKFTLRGLSSTPCTSYGPGGLSQEPPAGSGPCLSKGNQAGSGSHVGPPAQLLTSFPLFFIGLLFWEQLLPSHFRFDCMGFSSLHLLTTCLQLLLLLL